MSIERKPGRNLHACDTVLSFCHKKNACCLCYCQHINRGTRKIQDQDDLASNATKVLSNVMMVLYHMQKYSFNFPQNYANKSLESRLGYLKF